MKNPYREIITDEQLKLLIVNNAINKTTLRNRLIADEYREERKQQTDVPTIIENISQRIGYLEFDTLRKIAYFTKPLISTIEHHDVCLDKQYNINIKVF